MNFVAPLARPAVGPRFRTLLTGAAVAVLVAAGLGTTVLPGEDPPPATPVQAAPAPLPAAPLVPVPVAPRRDTAATTTDTRSGPTGVPPAPPIVDRAPARPADGAVAAPPPTSRSTLARSEPTRVRIPAIDVDSDLVDLGLDDRGRMEVPAGAFPAGWYTGAPTPGELGPAILAGHVDYGGVAGVFFRLRELEPGDAVEVTREDGTTAVFRVTHVEQHDKDAFPTAAVYGDIDHAGLRLITCGGAFDRGVRSYEDNIVVFAELDRHAGNG